MKLKYYLRGIGIGLIITTVVMALAFMLHKDELISDEEVRRRAEALGMVMPEETGGRDTLSNNDGASPEALNTPQGEKNDIGSGGDDAAAQPVSAMKDDENKPGGKDAGQVSEEKASDTKASDKKDASDKENADEADKKKDKNADEPEPGAGEEVELSIVGGEYSDIVSQKLYKAGLIEDAEDFNKYLADGGYDNLIQPGTYMIPVGADYDTIIGIITEKE